MDEGGLLMCVDCGLAAWLNTRQHACNLVCMAALGMIG